MKKNLLLPVLVSSLFFLFFQLGTAQVNEYSLVPVDLEVGPGDSTVEVDININLVDTIIHFEVFLYAEGSSNPVLDTVLTGGLGDADPLGFASPSLVSTFSQRIVNQYGPPSDPLYFIAVDFGNGVMPPANGLFCKMFYKVSGPGTLTFRTAPPSTGGTTEMDDPWGPVPINWLAEGEVGSFEVVPRVNKYSLVPVNLFIYPSGGTVEIDVHTELFEEYGMIKAFFVPLYAEGTSNPVLDTVLTGGLMDANPPAFYPPSLVDYYSQKIVNPYGPPTNPLYFLAMNFGQAGIIPPAKGLYCRMFYHVDGPGTLTFRTAVHSTGGPVLMNDYSGLSVPINWLPAGEVGSFEVIAIQPGDANRDGQITVSDVIFLINYLFKSGFSPNPLIAGDANCDGEVTVSDVIYLINYLFKGGPPPC